MKVTTLSLISIIAMFSLCFFPDKASAENRNEQKPHTCSNVDYVDAIRESWSRQRRDFEASLINSENVPGKLYYLQNNTHPLFWYAQRCNDATVLEGLLDLFIKAETYQSLESSYRFAYRGPLRRQSYKLPSPQKMWVNNAKKPEESVLNSSQFLALASDIARYIGSKPPETRSLKEQHFFDTYLPVLASHYQRWVIDRPGVFQGRGWGCRFNGKYVKTAMSHDEYLNKKRNYTAGNGDSPKYCNAVTDVDLWIISGTSNLIWLQERVPDARILPTEQINSFKIYLKNAYKLIEQRITYGSAKNFQGENR